MPIVATHADIARELGISRQRVGQLAKKIGFPVERDGSFDTEKIRTWRLATRKQKPHNSKKKPTTAEDEAQLAKDHEDQRLELKLRNRDRLLAIEMKQFSFSLKRQEYHPRSLTKNIVSAVSDGIRNMIMILRRAGNEEGASVVKEQLFLIERQVQELLEIESQ